MRLFGEIPGAKISLLVYSSKLLVAADFTIFFLSTWRSAAIASLDILFSAQPIPKVQSKIWSKQITLSEKNYCRCVLFKLIYYTLRERKKTLLTSTENTPDDKVPLPRDAYAIFYNTCGI